MKQELRIKEILRQEVPELADRVTVDIAWAPSQTIQQLNREHRQIDKPTDILSFPIYSFDEITSLMANPRSSNEPILLGSLVLCEEIIVERAKAAGQTSQEYTDWALGHGVKHLLGYDHDEFGQNWQPIDPKT